MTVPMIAVLPSTIFTIFVSYLPTLTLNWSLNSFPGLMTTRAQSQRSLVYSLLRSQHTEQVSTLLRAECGIVRLIYLVCPLSF